MNALSKNTFQSGLLGGGGSMVSDRLATMKRVAAPAVGVLLVACMIFEGSSMLRAGTQRDQFVAGQKLDSGLGDIPHYSQWTDRTGRAPLAYPVVGESLDSGLGELPHYSQWTDRTGRDPLAYHVVGESLDSGLGELPHYSKWTAATAGGQFGEVLRVSQAKF